MFRVPCFIGAFSSCSNYRIAVRRLFTGVGFANTARGRFDALLAGEKTTSVEQGKPLSNRWFLANDDWHFAWLARESERTLSSSRCKKGLTGFLRGGKRRLERESIKTVVSILVN